MTNQHSPHCADAVDASIIAMVHPRRPVKIVEHPAFRLHRRTDAIDRAREGHAPLLAMAFRVVSLN
jgi:hypothetical protein